MVEFAELLNCIRLAFVDNEKEIHEDEYETKYEGLRFDRQQIILVAIGAEWRRCYYIP